MRNLVIFGDSWPHGAELGNPDADSFPTLIKTQMGFDNVINLSEGAVSLQHYFLQLKKFVSVQTLYPKSAEYTVLVCMTSCVRDLYFSQHGEPMEIIPSDRSKIEYYADTFHWPETARLFWYRTIMMFQNYCQVHYHKDYYVQMFDNPPFDGEYNKLIDLNKIYKQGKVSMMQYLHSLENSEYKIDYNLKAGPELSYESTFYQKYFAPNVSHPNQLGHIEIADEISRFMRL